ncbi:hypothetical protein [Paenibacillus sp. FSL R7-0331]|uniref:hypothetical protein n=1 Tax=Paenibacillus sp. FSL R7-0331 TaxID=1536773 RepID=UPI0004F8FD1B|nr:hypothetical protein [Paenibacillus sp. FSL R7-0331]AIQ54522.1 hypothetical protein R70331_25365 [Paenibacillus sp. FSL R7-0331]
MKKKKEKTKPVFDIVFVKVEGDPIQAISDALEPNIRSVLAKHGAYLTMPLCDILRNHAKV